MRSHRNENGHTLLVVPREMIGPFRNALQKLAGGIDFFALDAAERDTLDQALRHLWNPGDDAQARDKTVPIDVLALTMRDGPTPGEPDPLDPPTVRRPAAPAIPSVLTRLSTRDRLEAAAQASPDEARPSEPRPSEPRPSEPRPSETRPTVELEREDLTASPERHERSAPRHDGYRAPTKGRHPDIAR